VTSIHTDDDRTRSDLIDSVLTLFDSALTLDFLFLFSKTDSALRSFLDLLNTLYTHSFSL